jgi:hypothetical protein
MSVKQLQSFICEDPQISGTCVKKVNLLTLNVPASGLGADFNRKPRAQKPPVPAMAPSRVALVLDAENCLDRLYGGCYPGEPNP